MEDQTEGRDPQPGAANAQPGGRSSRGPNPDPGGEVEPGGLIPPYDGRNTDSEGASNEARAESTERQLSDTKTSPPGQTSAPADEQPVSEDEVTDAVPDSPMGVGKSSTRSGEDVGGTGKEPGRREAGTQGESERPVGMSDERDSSGVDPQDCQPGAPSMPGQGG